MARWWPILSVVCLCLAVAHGQDKLEGVDVEEVCADRPADEYFRLETDGDCREVYRCDSAGEDGTWRLAPIRCAGGLAFDVLRQLCDWKSNVKSCDVLESK
ncbi:uncharacterized protein Dyak_GE22471 [Drosophila yakuba]|uniref:Chitin-binding type-2 domain-containing protein n=1 Tax=Drosophila yakuba TaxID=7245 RepID=B4PFZ0_DROYA|nr:uncharacterized protein Dyak_GE22471 [Drosophila yakuba]